MLNAMREAPVSRSEPTIDSSRPNTISAIAFSTEPFASSYHAESLGPDFAELTVEAEALVAETTGLMDDGWLDVQGSPITNAGRLVERFRRPNFGTLQIEVTIDDSKAYTRPFTATVNYRLSTDTQLIEFVCIEKSGAHYVGADGKPAQTK